MIEKFRYHSEILAIEKFSLGLRNFRYDCEIFVTIAKFLNPCENFAMPYKHF